jgi:hypothetical protein
MTELTKGRFNVRKLVLQLVIGAGSGGLITYGALTLLDGRGFDADDPSRMLALAVGLVFAVIGLFVALGLAMPRAGTQLLNVEDADELRDLGKALRSGAALFLLAGAGLLALALGGADGEQRLLSLTASAWIAAACFIGVVAVAIASRKNSDEMMNALSREASSLSLYVISVLAILWAVLAHLGRAPALDAIGVLAGILGIQLLAVMVVVGRGGLLAPR